MTTLQDNIRKLYEASGMSQADFAAQHGTTQKVLWTYIRGRSEPNYMFILSLCKWYSVHSEFLINVPIKLDRQGNITNKRFEDKKIEALKKKALNLSNEYHDEMLKIIKEIAWLGSAPQ